MHRVRSFERSVSVDRVKCSKLSRKVKRDPKHIRFSGRVPSYRKTGYRICNNGSSLKGRSMRALWIGKALDVSLKTFALLYAGNPGAEQVTVRVRPGYSFTPHRCHFESNHTIRKMQRQIQTIPAVTEPFVDDGGRNDHRQTRRAEVAGLPHEDKRFERFAGVGVEQRKKEL